jgi:HAD superfamily hydrolase (TIGR01509 family)
MIKAITFDLDGVYFPDGKKKFLTAIQELGVSEDEAKRVFLKSDEMNNQYKLGKMTDDEYWTWAAKEWKLDMTTQELTQLLVDSYSVDPHVEAVVKSVRANGYKTLICSNNFPARVNGLNERFHFLDNFYAAVFSHEVGAVKPSEAIFNELVSKSGVEASSIVYSDDDAEKLTGATAIGIVAFVYENFDQFTNELQKLGVKL